MATWEQHCSDSDADRDHGLAAPVHKHRVVHF